MTRLHEITFNAPLLAELRALELAERLITEGGLPRGTAPGQYRRIRLHRIVMDGGDLQRPRQAQQRLRVSSTACASSARPRRGVSSTEHFGDIGRKSTIDLGVPEDDGAAMARPPARR